MSASEPPLEPGTVIIPDGEKLIYKSELFDVIVRAKRKAPGLVRDRFLVAVELIEQDPLLERTALLDVPEEIWKDLSEGERCQARLYEQPSGQWSTKPPVGAR